jgi:hypothetical protein
VKEIRYCVEEHGNVLMSMKSIIGFESIIGGKIDVN